jgi:hypothetical protein
MTAPETSVLLPCPFCGGEAVDRREIDGFPMIYCAGHDCLGPQTSARTFQDALVQWNARDDSASEAALADLRTSLDWKGQDGIGHRKIVLDRKGAEVIAMLLRARSSTVQGE